MLRNINKDLSDWRNSSQRKVLLMRGARQVGKTYSIRELGKSFKYYLEVNFEEERAIKQFFQGSLNPLAICQKLSTYFNIPIIDGETLLFFDEIQACPEALSSLRFFYEKKPELHLAATGSLLEFALAEIPSQGVGRIHSVFLYPLSFDEFLLALGETALLEMKNTADTKHPLDDIFHQKLIDYLKIFFIIGGMPEIMNEFVHSRDILVCQNKLNDLLETLKDDFAKYKKRSPVQRLKEVFDSIALQSGGKFKYSNIDHASSHQAFKDGLNLIIQAGLAYKIFHTSAGGLPLGAQIKLNKFKAILLDTGLHQKILGLNTPSIISAENSDLINKCSLSEIFTGIELLKNSPPQTRAQLYYWHKEKRASNAEVDYLVQKNNQIIPLEVKSGVQGKMQSMRIFMNEHQSPYGIRVSLENFSKIENIYIYPLYAISNILRAGIA